MVPVSEELRKEIVQCLLNENQGMFQWAVLQLQQLIDLEIPRDIQERLGKLPKDLETAYDEIFEKVKHQPGSGEQIASRAFQWIMCSAEPLSTEVLSSAVSQNPEEDHFVDDQIPIDIILRACHHLITVDAAGYCHFSHLSVQEFIEKKARVVRNGFEKISVTRGLWKKQEAHTYAAQACLIMLNDLSAHKHSSFSFHLHARGTWHMHVRQCGTIDESSQLSVLLDDFLGSANQSGLSFRKCYRRVSQHLSNSDTLPTATPIFAICHFGLHNILTYWLKKGPVDFDQRNAKGNSLLYLASWKSCVSTVKTLVDAGANVNAHNGSGKTVLFLACAKGDEAIVRVLLKRKADIDQPGNSLLELPLRAAVFNGRQPIVELLLSSGANINKEAGCYGTALQYAARCSVDSHKHEQIVKMLLDKGADVNQQCGWYGTALQAAATKGKLESFQLLLAKGAELYTRSDYEGVSEAIQRILRAQDAVDEGPFRGRTRKWDRLEENEKGMRLYGWVTVDQMMSSEDEECDLYESTKEK